MCADCYEIWINNKHAPCTTVMYIWNITLDVCLLYYQNLMDDICMRWAQWLSNSFLYSHPMYTVVNQAAEIGGCSRGRTAGSKCCCLLDSISSSYNEEYTTILLSEKAKAKRSLTSQICLCDSISITCICITVKQSPKCPYRWAWGTRGWLCRC